jgi:hypothetical protein
MLAAEPEIALDACAFSEAPVAAYLPDLSSVNTIDQFAALAIGRADLSRAASRVAVEEASRADVKEFAGRELVEAETLVTVLEDLGTPLPQMGGERWATLAQIINTPAGRAFDAVYMAMEHEVHTYLKDLAAAYLRYSNTSMFDPREHYGRQFVGAALFAFIEHASVSRRTLRELAT